VLLALNLLVVSARWRLVIRSSIDKYISNAATSSLKHCGVRFKVILLSATVSFECEVQYLSAEHRFPFP
jgi:hypothetical protein